MCPVTCRQLQSASGTERDKKYRYAPGDEEDLALLAVLDGDEVEVEDGVAALVLGHGAGEVGVGVARLPQPVHHHLLRLLVDLERDEPEATLRLELQELELALVAHGHPRRRVRLATTSNNKYSSLILHCIHASTPRTASIRILIVESTARSSSHHG